MNFIAQEVAVDNSTATQIPNSQNVAEVTPDDVVLATSVVSPALEESLLDLDLFSK